MTPKEQLALKIKLAQAIQARHGRTTGRIGMPTSETALTPDVLKYRNQKSGIFPASTDERGNLQFDIHAGIPGAVLDALAVPGDVASGQTQVDLPGAVQQTTSLAALASPVPAASKLLQTVPRTIMPKTPTAMALKQAGSAGFEKARGMGVDYSSTAVRAMADEIRHTLESEGVLAELAPKTHAIIGKLTSPPEGSVASLDGLIAARRAFQNAAGDTGNPTERLAAENAIRMLDEFIAGAGGSTTGVQSSVVAGPAADAAGILEEARGNYAAAKRSESITGAQDRAELNAATANSGHNIGNQLRQQAKSFLLDPKKSRGFSAEEMTAIRQVAEGTATVNSTRHVANLLGGGGGLGQALTAGAGAVIAGVPGAMAAPLIGAAARHTYNRMVKSQVAKLDELIRQRSPAYQELLKTAPQAATSPAARAVFLRNLLNMLTVDGVPPPEGTTDGR